MEGVAPDLHTCLLTSQSLSLSSADATGISLEKSTTSSQPDFFTTYRVTINVYFIPVLCMIGFIGNALSIAVLCHDNERNNTTNLLLQSLAVVDTLYLVTCVFIQPLKTIHEETDWMPGLSSFLPFLEPHVWAVASTAQTMAVWIVLLITTDRFIAICLPWETTLRRAHRAKLALTVTVLAAALYNLPRYFEREVLEEFNSCTNLTTFRSHKTSLRNNRVYFLVYKTICYLLFRAVGPLAALFYLNLRLMKTLREVKRRRSDLMTSSSNNTENITLMLVVVVFVFVVCELPDLALRITVTIQEFAAPLVTFNIWTLKCVNIITNTLLTVNSSINFLIYCLVGKKFRQIFLRVYGCGVNNVDEFSRRSTAVRRSGDGAKMGACPPQKQPIESRVTVIVNVQTDSPRHLDSNDIVEL